MSSVEICKRKKFYASYKEASQGLQRTLNHTNYKRDKLADKDLEPYRCSHCPGWHVGHEWNSKNK